MIVCKASPGMFSCRIQTPRDPGFPVPSLEEQRQGLGVEQAFEDGKRLNQGMDTGWVQGIFLCVFDYQAGRRLIKMRKDLFVTYKHLVNEMADGQE